MTKPPKVRASKKASPKVDVNIDLNIDDTDDQATMLNLGTRAVEPELTVKLTRQLHGKLTQLAKEEGVSVDLLVLELLSEGATLRAFEVIESKAAMRGMGPSNPTPGTQQGRSGYHQGGRSGQHRDQRGGSNHPRHGSGRRPAPANSAWMEDRATFLEYVRNQERERR